MGTLQEDTAADFLLVDGLEPVQWVRHDLSGVPALTIQIPFALRRSAEETTVPGRRHTFTADEVVTTRNRLIWHVQRTALQEQIPREGDAIVDSDGVRWIVWEVQLQAFRTRYRLTCNRE